MSIFWTLLLGSALLNLASGFVLSDYFASSPSFNGHIYPPAQVHDVYIHIDEAKFQWILLGQERNCKVEVDNSPKYKTVLSLHGASTRFRPLAKKNYKVLLTTEDDKKHSLVFRHSYADPSYSREKLAHDAISNMGGIAASVTHVNLHINGEFNGLYQMVEIIDSEFMEKRFETPVDLWYYVKRVFDISIRTHDEEIESVSTKQILREDMSSLSPSKYEIYNPLYQPANESLPLHKTFDYSQFISFHVSRNLFAVTDTFEHNFFMVVDPNSKLLHLVLWDADKSLGIFLEDNPVDIKTLMIVQRIMNVRQVPSANIQVEGTGLSEMAYFLDAAENHLLTVLSDSALDSYVNNISTSLAESAKRDSKKWGRWYCKDRMDFDQATYELRSLLHLSRNNYLATLRGDEGSRLEGYYSHLYSCEENERGKPNLSMLIFLWCVFAFNAASFLVPPECNIKHIVTQYKTLERSQSGGDDFRVLGRSYLSGCMERLRSKDYLTNACVGTALVVIYYLYVLGDCLDDSEILGKEYMLDLKYIWIYFAVAMNLVFHLKDSQLRVQLWGLVVVVTNVYTILDLITFSGAETDEASINSRGLSLSFDAENPKVFALYACWRFTCQFVIMLYSFQIPQLTKELTAQWDASNDAELSPATHEESKQLNIKEVELRDLAVDEEGQRCDSGGDKYMQMTTTHSIGDDGDFLGNEKEAQRSGDECTEHDDDDQVPFSGTSSAQREYKLKMKLFMHINMAIFVAICVAYVIYLSTTGDLVSTVSEVVFSTVISLVIMINIRAFYSCVKWFWLHAYGFDTDTIDMMYSNREENWDLNRLKTLTLQPRKSRYMCFLPFQQLTTEKKIRAVDGWMKKIAHTYDGLLVFILSSESFAEGSGSSETYSFAYSVSLIYMLLYLVSYNSNGSLAWIIYGAKARVMDGFLGRENEIFGFMFDKYMLPVSAPLLLWLKSSAGDTDIVYYTWYIFMPIIIGDSVAEIVGGTWGTQSIKVWGMGEINKKSWEGTGGMFFSSLIILFAVNVYLGLSWAWYLFAIVTCFFATVIELWAYRSTDNVCMMIWSALLAVAFSTARS